MVRHKELLKRLDDRNIPYSYVASRMYINWTDFLAYYVCRDFEQPGLKHWMQLLDDAVVMICNEVDCGVTDVNKIREHYVDNYDDYVIHDSCPVPISSDIDIPQD